MGRVLSAIPPSPRHPTSASASIVDGANSLYPASGSPRAGSVRRPRRGRRQNQCSSLPETALRVTAAGSLAAVRRAARPERTGKHQDRRAPKERKSPWRRACARREMPQPFRRHCRVGYSAPFFFFKPYCKLFMIQDKFDFSTGLLSPVQANRGSRVSCPKCHSDALTTVPAEIRLYRDGPRTMSHPPLTPSPDVSICLDCGWSEFSVPRAWLSAGWLRPKQPARPAPKPFAFRI